MKTTQFRALTAELVGSFLLCGVVVGSGIMAFDLSEGNIALALLGNSLATAAILWVLVAILAPISGAHFNPAVTLAFFLNGKIGSADALFYVAVQVIGCILGAWLAHAMFDEPIWQIATTDRSGSNLLLSEALATFVLVFAIFGAVRHVPNSVPVAVALAILAGYWWTASTSFANPAITIGRMFSDSFTGIFPGNVPGFVFAQLVGGAVAAWMCKWLFVNPSNNNS